LQSYENNNTKPYPGHQNAGSKAASCVWLNILPLYQRGEITSLISKYTDGGSRFHWERGSLAGVFDVQFWLKDAEVLDLLTFCVYTYFIEGKVKI